MNNNHFSKGGSKAILFLLLTVSPLLNAQEGIHEPQPKLSFMRRLQTRFWRLSIRAGQHLDRKVAAIGALSGGLVALAIWHRHTAYTSQQHIEHLMQEKNELEQRVNALVAAQQQNSTPPQPPSQPGRLQRLGQRISTWWTVPSPSSDTEIPDISSLPGSGVGS